MLFRCQAIGLEFGLGKASNESRKVQKSKRDFVFIATIFFAFEEKIQCQRKINKKFAVSKRSNFFHFASLVVVSFVFQGLSDPWTQIF